MCTPRAAAFIVLTQTRLESAAGTCSASQSTPPAAARRALSLTNPTFQQLFCLYRGCFVPHHPCLHRPHFSDPSALPIRAAASSVPPWCSHPPLAHLCQPLLGGEARVLPKEPPWTRSKLTAGQPVHEQLQTSPGRTEQPLRDQV